MALFAEWCEVWRSATTARHLTQEKYSVVELNTGGPSDRRKNDAGITLTAEIPAKGDGTTRIRIFVNPGGYDELAAQMMTSAPDAAHRAFGNAIADAALTPRIMKKR